MKGREKIANQLWTVHIFTFVDGSDKVYRTLHPLETIRAHFAPVGWDGVVCVRNVCRVRLLVLRGGGKACSILYK